MKRGNVSNRMLFFSTFALLLAGFFASSYEESITGQAFGRSRWGGSSYSYRPSTYYGTPLQQQTQTPTTQQAQQQRQTSYTLTCTSYKNIGRNGANVKVAFNGQDGRALAITERLFANSDCPQNSQGNQLIYTCSQDGRSITVPSATAQPLSAQNAYNNILSWINTQPPPLVAGKMQPCTPAATGSTDGQPTKIQQGAYYTLTCRTYKSVAWEGATIEVGFTDASGKVTKITEYPFRNSVCQQNKQVSNTCVTEGKSLTLPSTSGDKPLSTQEVYNNVPKWASNPQSPLVKTALTSCISGQQPAAQQQSGSWGSGSSQPALALKQYEFGAKCQKVVPPGAENLRVSFGSPIKITYGYGDKNANNYVDAVVQETFSPRCSTSGTTHFISEVRECNTPSDALSSPVSLPTPPTEQQIRSVMAQLRSRVSTLPLATRPCPEGELCIPGVGCSSTAA